MIESVNSSKSVLPFKYSVVLCRVVVVTNARKGLHELIMALCYSSDKNPVIFVVY